MNKSEKQFVIINIFFEPVFMQNFSWGGGGGGGGGGSTRCSMVCAGRW